MAEADEAAGAAGAGFDLPTHLAYLRAAIAEAQAAPLSARKAMLAVLLMDAYADRLFAAQTEADDILAFRAGQAAAAPALGLVFDQAAGRARLVTEAVQMPLEEYDRLSVQDFMVSLYNGHTVQRVLVVGADGVKHDVHAVLAEAVGVLAHRRPPLP